MLLVDVNDFYLQLVTNRSYLLATGEGRYPRDFRDPHQNLVPSVFAEQPKHGGLPHDGPDDIAGVQRYFGTTARLQHFRQRLVVGHTVDRPYWVKAAMITLASIPNTLLAAWENLWYRPIELKTKIAREWRQCFEE